MLAVVVVGGELTGALPPLDVAPPLDVPLPLDDDELVEEAEVAADEPSDGWLPSEHPVIVSMAAIAAIAAIEVIRLVIGLAASRNKPLVRELNLSCTNFDQDGSNSRLR
jgi:hypothetical protein